VIRKGETSQVVNLFTLEKGALSLLAKGVQRAKSKSKGLFIPTHEVEVLYYYRPNRELHTFNSGTLLKTFSALRANFDRLLLAQLMLEMIYRGVSHPSPHPELYYLLRNTLTGLDSPTESAARLYWRFHLRFLTLLGFKPALQTCPRCGKSVERAIYLRAVGEVVCSSCATGKVGDIKLSPQVINAMRQLDNENGRENSFPSLKKSDRTLLWRFLWDYTDFHLDLTRRMRSLKVLEELRQQSKDESL